MEARLISTVVSRNSPSLLAGFHMQMYKKILRISIRPMQIPRKKAKRDAKNGKQGTRIRSCQCPTRPAPPAPNESTDRFF